MNKIKITQKVEELQQTKIRIPNSCKNFNSKILQRIILFSSLKIDNNLNFDLQRNCIFGCLAFHSQFCCYPSLSQSCLTVIYFYLQPYFPFHSQSLQHQTLFQATPPIIYHQHLLVKFRWPVYYPSNDPLKDKKKKLITLI